MFLSLILEECLSLPSLHVMPIDAELDPWPCSYSRCCGYTLPAEATLNLYLVGIKSTVHAPFFAQMPWTTMASSHIWLNLESLCTFF